MTEADESKVTRPTAEAGAVEPVAMKPCPWCGGEVGPVVEEGARFRWRRVTGCCAEGPEVRHDTMADDQAAAEVESRAAAIAAWNNRPVEDTLRAQLEAAERLVAAVEVQAEENFQKYVDANEARIDAEARAEAAEADAARYQLLKVWGRQMSIEGTGECNFGITTPTWRGPWIDLDAAIDAAIARTKEQQA